MGKPLTGQSAWHLCHWPERQQAHVQNSFFPCSSPCDSELMPLFPVFVHTAGSWGSGHEWENHRRASPPGHLRYWPERQQAHVQGGPLHWPRHGGICHRWAPASHSSVNGAWTNSLLINVLLSHCTSFLADFVARWILLLCKKKEVGAAHL